MVSRTALTCNNTGGSEVVVDLQASETVFAIVGRTIGLDALDVQQEGMPQVSHPFQRLQLGVGLGAVAAAVEDLDGFGQPAGAHLLFASLEALKCACLTLFAALSLIQITRRAQAV